jgi:hypothetical protein
MAASKAPSPPRWFRLVGVPALVWNAVGVAMYLSSVGLFGDPNAGLSAAERAAAASIPAFITGAFAVGTFTGLVGSLGLLLARRWAWPVLLLSAVALLILEGWIVFLSDAVEAFGLAVPITVAATAVLLAWLASEGSRRGWLR